MSKFALVTGGARRLGKDISLALAEEGFNIILNYHSTPAGMLESAVSQLREKKVEVYAIKADVSVPDEINKMFEEISEKIGRLDVLVNNAAIFRYYDFFDIEESDLDEFINTNLKSVFFCSQKAAELMLKDKTGVKKIINISSLGGILNWTGYIPYSLSKVGVIKLTQLMAKRLAPDIVVNSIAPGTIVIEGDDNKNVDEKEVSKYPMKRFGNSKDITGLIKYLASENNYITGQTIAVDGGRSL